MSRLIITGPGTRAAALMRQFASACLPDPTHSDTPQEPTMTKSDPPLRYSLAATMAQRTGQPTPEAKPFNLAQAMRQKVERDRSTG